MTVTPSRSSAFSAFSKVGPSCTITTPGLIRSNRYFSLSDPGSSANRPATPALPEAAPASPPASSARARSNCRERIATGLPGSSFRSSSALRQRIHGALGLAIGQLAPLPVGARALRQPDPLGRFLRPFRQRGRDMLLVGLQRNPRLQNDDAVGPPLDRDIALQPFDLAKGRLCQNRGAFPLILRLPEIRSLCGPLFLALDITGFRFSRSAMRCRLLRALPLWERASSPLVALGWVRVGSKTPHPARTSHRQASLLVSSHTRETGRNVATAAPCGWRRRGGWFRR